MTEIYRTESQIEENYIDKKLQKSAQGLLEPAAKS